VLFGVIRFGRAELDVGMAENCPSRVGALSGEKGRLGRYEYAEEVSGRLRYFVSLLPSPCGKRDILLGRKQQIKQLYQGQQLELYQSTPARNLVLPAAEPVLDLE
jgi:hypothetical protein